MQGLLDGMDFEREFDQVREQNKIEVRDPLLPPYGDEDKTTDSQQKIWDFRLRNIGTPSILAVIGAKGSGKGLPADEPVLTPSGWVENGSLEVGDEVIGSDGHSTTVTGVFPQPEKDLYEVEFNDGVVVRCDEDHLWAVHSGSMRYSGTPPKVMDTTDLAADLTTSQGYAKWCVPNVQPVEFEDAGEKPIEPYSLGASIGDSHDKFIPQAYLRGSSDARVSLLRGLMDTGGTVSDKGSASFCTASERLAGDVVELVRSLGGITRARKRRTSGGGHAYRVTVDIGETNPFWIECKAGKFKHENGHGLARSIQRVEKVGRGKTICIRVVAADSLYVTTGYTVTHNTHTGACFDVYNAQKYPGSLGCIISNTYQQAKDNAVPELLKAAARVQVPINFYSRKKVRGRPFTSVFVLDIDGAGFEQGRSSFILLRSFEAVKKIEGVELDYLHGEEIQDADQSQVARAISRVRGSAGDNAVFLAGMPEDELHWQYDFVEGLIADTSYAPAHLEDTSGYERGNGILLEPSLYENIQNVGQGYIDRLKNIYGGAEAQRLIHGRRASVDKNKVFHNFDVRRHVKGRMPQVLGGFDKQKEIYFVFDFNVAPMSVTAWQIKPWNDAWYSEDLTIEEDAILVEDEDGVREIESLSQYAEAERKVGVCVDHFEVWNGGTKAVCDRILEKYGSHANGIGVFGDATSDRKNTVTTENDYDIIQHTIGNLPNSWVRRGLKMSHNVSQGGVRTSNPLQKETINSANKLLSDAEGNAHVCFAPDNEYQSGGVVKSVSLLEYKADGNVDKSSDRKDGREIPRSHFADTFRYFAWWFDGEGQSSSEDYEDKMKEAARAMRAIRGASSRRGRNNAAFGF